MYLLDLPPELLYRVLGYTTPLQITGFTCASRHACLLSDHHLKSQTASPTLIEGIKSWAGQFIHAFRKLRPGLQDAIQRTPHILPFPNVFKSISKDEEELYVCTMSVCESASENAINDTSGYDRFIMHMKAAGVAAKKAGLPEPDFGAERMAVAGNLKSLSATFARCGDYAKLSLYAALAKEAMDAAGIPESEFRAEEQKWWTAMTEPLWLSVAKCGHEGDHTEFERQAARAKEAAAKAGLSEPEFRAERQKCWIAAAENLGLSAARYTSEDDYAEFEWLADQAQGAAKKAGLPESKSRAEVQRNWKIVAGKLRSLAARRARHGDHKKFKECVKLAREAAESAGLPELRF